MTSEERDPVNAGWIAVEFKSDSDVITALANGMRTQLGQALSRYDLTIKDVTIDRMQFALSGGDTGPFLYLKFHCKEGKCGKAPVY